MHKFLETLQMNILLCKNYMIQSANQLQRPVDCKIWVVPNDSIIIFAIKPLGAFVRHDRFLEHQISVPAPGGDENLARLIAGEIKREPLTKRRAVLAQIYHHVVDVPVNAANELWLLLDALKMDCTYDALMGCRVKHLGKIVRNSVLLENYFRIILGKEAANIIRLKCGYFVEALYTCFLKLEWVNQLTLPPAETSTNHMSVCNLPQS